MLRPGWREFTHLELAVEIDPLNPYQATRSVEGFFAKPDPTNHLEQAGLTSNCVEDRVARIPQE